MGKRRKFKPRNQGNPRKKPSNGSSKDSTKEEYGEVKSPTNDPAWYAQTPELMRDATNVQFVTPIGAMFDLDIEYGNVVPRALATSVPGVMTLSVIPCIGQDSDQNSCLNIAAKSFYSYVRRTKSGTALYDTPDLMMYALAMANIYSYLVFLQRVYGVAVDTNIYNRYMPQALVEAQGVDYDSITDDLANYRFKVNVLIRRAASMACPANMTYFRRLAFLFAGLYSEGDSVKDQLYMLIPEGFMQFSETASTKGSSLVYKQLQGTGHGSNNRLTAKDLFNYGMDLINAVLNSGTTSNMSGDIETAFGSNILALQLLDESYAVKPSTDLNVLEQIKNADFLGIVPTAVVQQDPDVNGTAIFAYLTINQNASTQCLMSTKNSHLLTTIRTDPKTEDVMEMTRFQFNYESISGDTDTFNIICAADVAVKCAITQMVNGATTTTEIVPAYFLPLTPSNPTSAQIILTHCMLENFKFHPSVRYFSAAADGVFNYLSQAIDIDNYAIISEHTLRTINDAALYGLFNFGQIQSNASLK